MKTIDFETHFVTQEWVDATYANPGYPRFADDPATGSAGMYYREDAFEPHGDFLLNRLLDWATGRIAEMDEGGIDKAILSLTSPGVDHFDPASAPASPAGPTTSWPPPSPSIPTGSWASPPWRPRTRDAAAAELERCVKELGFKGWKTHSNFGDSYIDEKRYWPILAKAEELGVVIYLHPVAPMIKELRTYGLALAGAAFGFGVETATAMMRLVLSRRLRRLPEAQDHARPLRRGSALPHAAHRPPVRAAAPQGRRPRGRCPISSGCRASICATTC